MSLLTKKQFSVEYGIATNKLSVYISRNKVILKNDLIDTTNEINRAFIEKNCAAKTVIEVAKPTSQNVKTEKPKPESFEFNLSDGVPTLTESTRVLKYKDTIKRDKEIEKLQIEIEQKKGIVIPSELVKPVFLQHNQFVTTEFKNAADELLRRYSKKHSLNSNEIAEMKGELVEVINVAIKKATQSSIKNVSNIIKDFSVKKGVGEHG